MFFFFFQSHDVKRGVLVAMIIIGQKYLSQLEAQGRLMPSMLKLAKLGQIKGSLLRLTMQDRRPATKDEKYAF